MKNTGLKHDRGKLPWYLLPWDAMIGVVKAFAFGAEKYGERNWEKGMGYHRLYRAAINHTVRWWLRHPADEETGLSHLLHAICCLLFLAAYEIRGTGIDDRPTFDLKPDQDAPSNEQEPRQESREESFHEESFTEAPAFDAEALRRDPGQHKAPVQLILDGKAFLRDEATRRERIAAEALEEARRLDAARAVYKRAHFHGISGAATPAEGCVNPSVGDSDV